MKVTLNGYEMAKLIGSNPGAFPDVRVELQNAVIAIVAAQLKSKTLTLDKVRAIRAALSADSFLMVLGYLDKPLASVTKRLDPHTPDQKSASADWHRKHIAALASGDLQPAEKPARTATKKQTTKSPGKKSLRVTEENFYPKSMTTAVGSRNRRSGGS